MRNEFCHLTNKMKLPFQSTKVPVVVNWRTIYCLQLSITIKWKVYNFFVDRNLNMYSEESLPSTIQNGEITWKSWATS